MIQIRIGNAVLSVSRVYSLKCNDNGLEILFKDEEKNERIPLSKRYEKEESSSHNKFVIPNDFYDEDPKYLEKYDLEIKNKDSESKSEKKKEVLSKKEKEYLVAGAESLRSLAMDWSVNYRKDAEQPDRQKILRETIEFDYGKMHKYIEHCGGLTHAIIECTELERSLARDISMNICQVSSILFPPLSQLCELSFKV